MTTLDQIQQAVIGLGEEERKAFATWFASQSAPRMLPDDESRLLESLDRAVRELDAGRGTPLRDARELVRKWAGK